MEGLVIDMVTKRDFRTSSKKELLYYYANSVYNTHYGRVIAQAMIDNEYTYSEVARRAGLSDPTNVRVIVSGQRRDPYFSSLAKIAMALDLTLDRFTDGVK